MFLDQGDKVVALADRHRSLETEVGSLEKLKAQLTAENDEAKRLVDQHQLLKAEIGELEQEQRRLLEMRDLEAQRPPPVRSAEWTPVAIKQRQASSKSTVGHEVASYVRETFSQFLPHSVDFDVLASYVEDEWDVTARQEVGRLGEEAVFKQLRDSGLFEQVIWSTERQSGYNIEIRTRQKTTIYVEVKSTSHDRNGRIGHYFSRPQLELFASATPDRQSVLAFVFSARDPRPMIYYFVIGPFDEMRRLG
jgi:hypothetical protein